MQARRLPLIRSFTWPAEGLRLWRRNPGLLTFAVFAMDLLVTLISALPLAGPPLAAMSVPMFLVGQLTICRALDEGRTAAPDMLQAGFRKPIAARLAVVGGVMFIGSLLAVTATLALDGGVLRELFEGTLLQNRQPEDISLLPTFLYLAVFMAPTLMLCWFAPILISMWHVPPFKAMVFSLIACTRNWLVLLAFAALVFIVIGPLIALFATLLGQLAPALGILAMLVLIAILLPTLIACYYLQARDIFASSAADDLAR